MLKSLFLLLTTLLSTLILGIPALIIVWFTPHTVFRFSQLWCYLVMKMAIGVKLEISGRKNLVKGQSYIFLANHQSAFDIPALIYSIPFQTRFIAKKELGRIPIWGWAVSAMGHVMIDRKNIQRAKESINSAMEKIKKEGLSIVAYPEGTRTRDGKVRPFKKGTFILAIQSEIPIVPISITGAYGVFPRKSWVFRKGTIRINIHPPVETKGYVVEDRDKLIETVRDIIVNDVEPRA